MGDGELGGLLKASTIACCEQSGVVFTCVSWQDAWARNAQSSEQAPLSAFKIEHSRTAVAEMAVAHRGGGGKNPGQIGCGRLENESASSPEGLSIFGGIPDGFELRAFHLISPFLWENIYC